MIISGILVIVSGHYQMQWVFDDQPMKAASAEVLCKTETDPNLSLLSKAPGNNCENADEIMGIPGMLSWLIDGKTSGVTVEGIENLQHKYEKMYGPGDYRPNILVTYWCFRLMIAMGVFSLILAIIGLVVTSKGKMPSSKHFERFAVFCLPFPFIGHALGWIMTEMGRQPWIVHPNPSGDPRIHLTVDEAVSPLAPHEVWISVIGFTLVYLILAVVWFYLMRRYTAVGLRPADKEPLPEFKDDDNDGYPDYAHDENGDPTPLSFAY